MDKFEKLEGRQSLSISCAAGCLDSRSKVPEIEGELEHFDEGVTDVPKLNFRAALQRPGRCLCSELVILSTV